MNQDFVKKIAIDFFMESSLGAKYQEVMEAFEKIQILIVNYQNKSDEKGLMTIKAGTTIVLGILKKIACGKSVSEFTNDDWAEIAKSVVVNAVIMDDAVYSKLVFGLYADYIEFSAAQMKGFICDEKVKQIQALSKELQEKAKQLDAGKISEVTYTENCLWICLEAMIKLLATDVSIQLHIDKWELDLSKEEQKILEELPEIVSMFAFEFTRYKMYEKELALITEYLEKQQILDEELSARYARFQDEFEKEFDAFNRLLESAFNPNFRVAFMGSIKLAQAVGVKQDELLTNIADIDDYFND